MSASQILHLCLWLATVTGIEHGCPVFCTCSGKYNRPFADCSNRYLIKIPSEFPHNITYLNLKDNEINFIVLGSFDNVTQLTSLWMAHNRIDSIEEGSIAPLVRLRNFDISYNKIVDFPWADLQNLVALQLLKMDHNEMVSLPRDAFANLRYLKFLRLNDNRFSTIAEGTFSGLISLLHLQLYNNPFMCTCSIDWLRNWILTASIVVPEQGSIICAGPHQLKGAVMVKLAKSKCIGPNVTITTEPNLGDTVLYENSILILNCEFKGDPKPLVTWKIQTYSQTEELILSSEEEEDSVETTDTPLDANKPAKSLNKGTLIIEQLSEKDSGNYSCTATNKFGTAADMVSVEVVPSPNPTETETLKVTESPIFIKTNPSVVQPVAKTSTINPLHLLDLKRKDSVGAITSIPPPVMADMEYIEQTPSYNNKCSLTAATRYVSNHAFNGSLTDVRQFTFDFGVIALAVSETEAKVRLNPLLLREDRPSVDRDPVEEGDSTGVSGRDHTNGLYLCVIRERGHSAVQWMPLRDGINTYVFADLQAATNYSLCLTYRGEDCEVQVLFTTRRSVPSLLIIISVSICLLTVSTVPLLGATCFHLVYKYRGKTYKLIMKAKDQYHMERNLAANFHVHAGCTESRRNIAGSEQDDEEAEVASGDGGKGGDAEDSVATESFALSQCNVEDYEAASDHSDRLPLGAEAVNITSNYKYPNNLSDVATGE